MLRHKLSFLTVMGMLIIVSGYLLVTLDLSGVPTAGKQDGDQMDPLNSSMDGSTKPIELHVTVSMGEADFVLLEEANRRFLTLHPAWTIKLTNIALAEAYNTMKRNLRLGNTSDIMLIPSEWVWEFAVRGYLLPVNAAIPGEVMADQLTSWIESLKWNGYLWGVPKSGNPYITVWSKDLLRHAGLTEPPVSWEEFVKTAALLNKSDPDAKLWNADPGNGAGAAAWLAAMGSEHSGAERLRALTETDAGKLHYLQEHFDQLSILRTDMDSGSVLEHLVSGSLLSASVPWSAYFLMSERDKLHLAISRNGVSLRTGVSSFVVTSGSKSEEEADEWILAMTNPEFQQSLYEQTGLLPTWRSLYQTDWETDRHLSKTPPAWLMKQLNAASAAEFEPQWPRRSIIWGELWREWLKKPDTEGLVNKWNATASYQPKA